MGYGRAQTSEQLGPKSPVCLVLVRRVGNEYDSVINCSVGTYAPDPSDSSGINSDKIGITWVTFDSTSGSVGKATPRIFVGVADVGRDNVYVSNDAGVTCSSLPALYSLNNYLLTFRCKGIQFRASIVVG